MLYDGQKIVFAHMTPGNRLQYLGWQLQKGDPVDRSGVDVSIERIFESAQAAGMDRAKMKYILVAEPGISHQSPNIPFSKYSIESTEESFDHIREIFQELGIPGNIVESAVSDFSVLYAPEDGGIYVTGYGNGYVDGSLRSADRKENIRSNFISTD